MALFDWFDEESLLTVKKMSRLCTMFTFYNHFT